MVSTNLDTQGVTADVLYPQTSAPLAVAVIPTPYSLLASKAGLCEQQPPPQTAPTQEQ